jgi:hypothetical protein
MSEFLFEGDFLPDAAFDRFRELFTKGRNQGLTEMERVEIRHLAFEIANNLQDEGDAMEEQEK